jgi:hypothetical protein
MYPHGNAVIIPSAEKTETVICTCSEIEGNVPLIDLL